LWSNWHTVQCLQPVVSSPLVCKLVLMGACGVGYILMSICRSEGITVVRFEMVPYGVNICATHTSASIWTALAHQPWPTPSGLHRHVRWVIVILQLLNFW
jgi:hypothetical protein